MNWGCADSEISRRIGIIASLGALCEPPQSSLLGRTFFLHSAHKLLTSNLDIMPGSQPLTFCLVSQIPRPAPRHRSSEAGSHEAVSHFNLLHVCSDLCLDQRNSRRRWSTALAHSEEGTD